MRRDAHPGGPHRRGAGDRAERPALWPRPSHGPAEDRHARRGWTAAPSTDARLEAQPGDEPPVPFSFLTRAHHDAADRLPHHRDDARDARDHRGEHPSRADVLRADREHRPALLPVHRGQGGALRRSRQPPDLPGAGGPGRRHRLSERHLHLAARGCAAAPS